MPKTRFVLVHLSPSLGMYVLTDTNQGRYHFDCPIKAKEFAQILTPQIKEKLGVGPVKVIPATCYMTGDCCATVFTSEYVNQHAL